MKTLWFFMAPLLAIVAIAAIAAEHPHQFPGCIPVAQRAGEKLGCFVTANQVLGKLPNAPVSQRCTDIPALKHGTC
jgi:hypothetical protein